MIASLFSGIEEKIKNSIEDRYREYYFSASTSAVPVFDGVVEILGKLNQENLFSCCSNRKETEGSGSLAHGNGTG